jgi:Fur family ferric uptake transcriptional regulator
MTKSPSPSRRQTWQKDAVLHALSQSQGFVSAQQLHRQLTQHGSVIGLATVYRTLNLLVTDGLADSLVSKEGESLFRDCSSDHHHHLICNGCGITVEIEAREAENWASKVAKDNGFTDVSHTIEIFGLCKKCSAKSKK